MKRRMEVSQHCWKFIYKHSDTSIFASTPARIWKRQGATGQKGTVIRETEYLDLRKNMKISSPIQFQLTIIPKSVFLAIKFNKGWQNYRSTMLQPVW